MDVAVRHQTEAAQTRRSSGNVRLCFQDGLVRYFDRKVGEEVAPLVIFWLSKDQVAVILLGRRSQHIFEHAGKDT